jgi:O-antigen/teichoic acid export membrane protein
LVFKEHIHLVNYGWPLAFWFTVSSLLNVSDRYIIGYYLNAAELGTYSIYDLLYKGITLLYSPILVAGYPIMKKSTIKEIKKCISILKKLILFEVIIFLVIVTIAFFSNHFFIKSVVEFYFISIVKVNNATYLWSFCLAVSYADS